MRILTLLTITTCLLAIGSLAKAQVVEPLDQPFDYSAAADAPPSIVTSPDTVLPAPLVGGEGRTMLDDIFQTIALEVMPREYEDLREWNKTHRFTTGWKIEREGLRIETHRRRKELNHGRWRKYRVELADEEDLDLRVLHVHRTDDGRISFDVHVIARFDLYARQSNWRRGIQLYSLSAQGEAEIDLLLNCVADIRLDATRLLPEVVIEPEVTGADLLLVDFDIDRISKIGGDVAEELGRTVRKRLAEKLAEKDDKLVTKINEKIQKESEHLRLSLRTLATSSFGDLTKLAAPTEREAAE